MKKLHLGLASLILVNVASVGQVRATCCPKDVPYCALYCPGDTSLTIQMASEPIDHMNSIAPGTTTDPAIVDISPKVILPNADVTAHKFILGYPKPMTIAGVDGVFFPNADAEWVLHVVQDILPQYKEYAETNGKLVSAYQGQIALYQDMDKNQTQKANDLIIQNEQLSKQLDAKMTADDKWYNSKEFWVAVGAFLGAGMSIGVFEIAIHK